MDDFRKYAVKHLGMSSMVLDDVIKSQSYLNPYILEERQLNVTQLDVFSRLMMDRIIFLGERHLYLHQLSGRVGICRSGHLRHDAIHRKRCSYDLYRHGCFDGCRIACSRERRQTLCPYAFAGDDSPADGRRARPGFRYRNHRTRDSETEERALYHYRRTFTHRLR